MPCEYSVVKIDSKRGADQKKKQRQKKKKIQSRKETLVKSLVGMGFEPEIQPTGSGKLFILGSSSRGKIEILFDEKTGQFVTHFSGVETHDEEHKILDKLVETLKTNGLAVSVNHYHEKPKLPEYSEPHRHHKHIYSKRVGL